MKFFEVSEMTDAQFELFMAEKTLEALTPEVEEVKDWINEDFGAFNFEDFNQETTEEQKRIIELQEQVENLKQKVESEKVEAINTKIQENNNIIAELRKKIQDLKPTKAGKSFLNFFTGKYQFMTFTEINAAKINNQITCILNENKDLKKALI